MKYTEASNLDADQLKERLEAEQENLRKLKFAHAISPIENPMKIKYARRTIARLKTAQNSRKRLIQDR
jgi:large subunit ribosomal protein L29